MPGTPSKFIWYDVMTTDCTAAETFYRSAIGWTTADSGMSDRRYTLLSAAGTLVGGLMPIPPDVSASGEGPAWMGYLWVNDVDGHAGRVVAAGGRVHRSPEDIPGVGRFAVAADPQGAGFILFKPNGTEAPSPVAPGTPGHIGWHELRADDLNSAWRFYSTVFGWTKADAMDMGPMGLYQMFATGDQPVGGMMKRAPESPQPYWLYYINVEALDAAIARVTDGGGKVVYGPQPVPGGSWIANCFDPQGAFFGMVASRR